MFLQLIVFLQLTNIKNLQKNMFIKKKSFYHFLIFCFATVCYPTIPGSRPIAPAETFAIATVKRSWPTAS